MAHCNQKQSKLKTQTLYRDKGRVQGSQGAVRFRGPRRKAISPPPPPPLLPPPPHHFPSLLPAHTPGLKGKDRRWSCMDMSASEELQPSLEQMLGTKPQQKQDPNLPSTVCLPPLFIHESVPVWTINYLITCTGEPVGKQSIGSLPGEQSTKQRMDWEWEE